MRRYRARGITLLEVALAMAVASIALAGIVRQQIAANEQIKARAVAEKMAEVNDAAKAYMKSHMTDLIAATGGGVIVTIPMTGAGPSGSLPSFAGGDFLPVTFNDTNGYGQSHYLLVRQPSANVLDGLVVTSGGQTIPDNQLGRIASLVGADGGFVPTNPVSGTAGDIPGVAGGWGSNTANWAAATVTPTAGHIAATTAFNGASLLTSTGQWLSRVAVAGHPEYNQMSTAIDMNGNALNNASTVETDNLNPSTGSDTLVGGNLDLQGTHEIKQVTQVDTATVYYSGGTEVTVADNVQMGGNNIISAGDVDMQTMQNSGGSSIGVNDNLQMNGNDIVNAGQVDTQELHNSNGTQIQMGDDIDLNAHALRDIADGTVNVIGSAQVSQSLIVGQAVNMGTWLNVGTYANIGGNATIGGDATVSGSTTLNGTVAVNSGLGATTTAVTVDGAVQAGSYYYTSDRRLKKNIRPLKDALQKILALNGYTFNWRKSGQGDVGLIAQEVEKIYPDLVYTNPRTGFKAVKYGNLVAPIIEGMKQLQDQNDQMRLDMIKMKVAQQQELSPDELQFVADHAGQQKMAAAQ